MRAEAANLDMSERNVSDVEHACLRRFPLAVTANCCRMGAEHTLSLLAGCRTNSDRSVRYRKLRRKVKTFEREAENV